MKVMNMLGINIQCLSYEDMFQVFDKWLSDKTTDAHAVSVINVHICVSAFFDQKLREIYNTADMSGSDGMPFLKWARAFYNKNSDRFYAPDLMNVVSEKAKEKGYTYFLYGGFPGAPEKIEAYLAQRHEGIRVVGKISPPFRTLTEEEDKAICKQINEASPDFLWIGLGSPKQDVWIYEHKEKLKGCIIMPSGATFDFFSGRIKQAPKWVRDSGFEWLFRLTQDFRRLWVRYIVYNAIFIVLFFLQRIRILTFDLQGNALFLGRQTRFGNL